MSMILMLALSLAATEPAAAPAADAPAKQTPAPAKTAAERDKEKVCINVTPTGSVMTQRVCKTRKQWRQIEERGRRQADDALDASGSRSRPE